MVTFLSGPSVSVPTVIHISSFNFSGVPQTNFFITSLHFSESIELPIFKFLISSLSAILINNC